MHSHTKTDQLVFLCYDVQSFGERLFKAWPWPCISRSNENNNIAKIHERILTNIADDLFQFALPCGFFFRFRFACIMLYTFFSLSRSHSPWIFSSGEIKKHTPRLLFVLPNVSHLKIHNMKSKNTKTSPASIWRGELKEKVHSTE